MPPTQATFTYCLLHNKLFVLSFWLMTCIMANYFFSFIRFCRLCAKAKLRKTNKTLLRFNNLPISTNWDGKHGKSRRRACIMSESGLSHCFPPALGRWIFVKVVNELFKEKWEKSFSQNYDETFLDFPPEGALMILFKPSRAFTENFTFQNEL